MIDFMSQENAKHHKCETAGIEFQIDDYVVNDISYKVDVFFDKQGLGEVLLTYDFYDPSAYEKALSELKERYGDPTFVPKGDHAEWIWVKSHGNLSLSAYSDASFAILYSRKNSANTL